MKFALILDGDNAPTPAPRIDAIPSKTGIGIYSESCREIWQADANAIKEALPYRYRRLHFHGPWHNKESRIDATGHLVGYPPYCTLSDTRGRRKFTVYLLPAFEGIQS
jgi:hypothetical protein